MSGRTWILLLTILLSVSHCSAKMNVVFILVDDWGVTDAAVLGSDYYETPNIDRFASNSLRFTQAYSASPVCSPTRAAIMTGRSPARLDMTIWHEGAVAGGPKNRRLREAVAMPNLPRDETTLAELFKAAGYYTAHIGKWHLGKAAWYPETQGYDLNVGGTYWGAPASFFYPYRGTWSRSDPELRYVPVGPGHKSDYLTDKLTDHAVSVIRERSDEPFFVSLWFHTVHTPIQGKPAVVQRMQEKSSGVDHRHAEYGAMVSSLDENVGRVLNTLRDEGLADNTIVVLTSDNGGVDFPSRKSGDRPPTSNAPFRSGKGTLYEGGIRVPLMIRWPGLRQSNAVCNIAVTSEDFLPTLADGCELEIPDALELDGHSLMPLIRDASGRLERTKLCWHYPHYYPRMTPGSAVRSGEWKLIHSYEDDSVELFNLETDVGETTDLSRIHPERVTMLRTMLDDWRRNVGANAPQPNPEWQPQD